MTTDQHQPLSQAADPPIPWRAIIVLGTAAFGSSASLRMCDPLLPKFANEFSTTVGAAAAVVTGFAIAYGLCQLATGPLGDRFGKTRIIAIGTVLAGLFTLASTFAETLDQLTILRVLAGLTGAAIIPNSLAHLGDSIPLAQRQMVLARFMLAMNFGVLCGQAVGGVIADVAGWRGVFVLVGTILVASGLSLALGQRVDPFLRGPSRAERAGDLGSAFRVLRDLPRRALPRLVLTTVFLEAALFFGPFTFLGAHLRQVHGLDYAVIGALTALSSVGSALYAFLAPGLIARHGERRLVAIGGLLFAVGLGGLALAPSVPAIAVAVIILGFGFVLVHNSLQTNATQMYPSARGASVAAFAFSFFMGQMLGVTLCGLAYDTVGAPPLFAVGALLLPVVVWRFRRGLARLAAT